jgi:hypothetical protein
MIDEGHLFGVGHNLPSACGVHSFQTATAAGRTGPTFQKESKNMSIEDKDDVEAVSEPSTALVPTTTTLSITKKRRKSRAASRKDDKLSTERYTHKRRLFLDGRDPEENDQTRDDVIDEKLYQMVKLGPTDPKFAGPAVKAAEVLASRSHGRVSPSEAELDRLLTHAPIFEVHVAPMALPHAEVVDADAVKPPTQPSFANDPPFVRGEVISTNAAPNEKEPDYLYKK